MNNKEIVKKQCKTCDSEYKLIYSQDEVQSLPKFCPFCGEEDYDDDEELTWDDED